jgi:hypothetical protein
MKTHRQKSSQSQNQKRNLTDGQGGHENSSHRRAVDVGDHRRAVDVGDSSANRDASIGFDNAKTKEGVWMFVCMCMYVCVCV